MKLCSALLALALVLGQWLGPFSAEATTSVTLGSGQTPATTVVDSYLDQFNLNTNQDASLSLSVYSKSAQLRRAVVRFDLSTIPSDAYAKTATLSLWKNGGTTSHTHETHQITGATLWVENQVTWNSRATGTSWTTAGGDFNATVTSTATTGTTNAWINWDVLAIVQSWLGATPSTNNGILIKDSLEGTGSINVTFATAQDGTLANRPKLAITYLRKVTGLTATAGDTQVNLSWTLPGGSPDYNGTLIIRRAGSAPTSTPTDGTVYTAGSSTLADGSLVVFNNTALATTFTNTGLTNGTTYYYQAFARDSGNLYSFASATVSVTPACGTPNAAAYVSANGQNGTINVYWSGENVVILERQTTAFTTEAPSNGTTYIVGNTGGPLGTAVVRSVGTGTSLQRTGLLTTTTYSYKVFVNNGSQCYSPGTVVNLTPNSGTQPAWSYTLAGGSTLKPGIAGWDGTVNATSNASRITSLNATSGAQNWSPVATTLPVQGWLSWLPNAWSNGWNSGWNYRKPITIDFTKVSATLTNFPVLISLTDVDLQSKAQSTGNDIVFTSSDGTTKLSHEIEKYDSATGTLVAWIKVPSLSSTANTVLYMYYGNAAAANQQNAVNTWDANFKAVWHLSQDPGGTGAQMKDSTVNANHGTSAGAMTSANQVAGKVGDGTNFDGVNDQINLSGFSAITAPWTLEFWIRPVDLDSTDRHFFNLDGGAGGYPTFDSKNSGQGKVLLWHGGSMYRYGNKAWAAGDNNTWWQLVFVIADTTTPSNWRIYLNGADISDPTMSTGTFSAPSTSGNIGSRGGSFFFKGIMDEVRVSNAVRSAGWVLTEYNNQNSPATFYSVGSEGSAAVIGGDQSGRVYSVDTLTGATKWTADLSAKANNIQAAVSAQLRAYANAAFQSAFTTDVLFAASRNTGATNCGASTNNNKLFALKVTDGTTAGWTFNDTCTSVVDYISGMPYVDYARNRVYLTSGSAGNTQPSFWVVNSLSGALIGSLSLNDLDSSPTLSYDRNTIYVGNTAGTLYAIDANATSWTLAAPPTGAVKWSLSVGAAAIKGFVWEDYSTAGKLYFSTANDVVSVQDNTTSGTILWRQSTAGPAPIAGPSTPLLNGGLGAGTDKLYVGSTDFKLHQLNLTSGVDEKQTAVLDGTTVGEPSTDDGTNVYVGSGAGKLYKIQVPLP